MIAKDEMVDPNWTAESDYIELELWKYNPDVFKKDIRKDNRNTGGL